MQTMYAVIGGALRRLCLPSPSNTFYRVFLGDGLTTSLPPHIGEAKLGSTNTSEPILTLGWDDHWRKSCLPACLVASE